MCCEIPHQLFNVTVVAALVSDNASSDTSIVTTYSQRLSLSFVYLYYSKLHVIIKLCSLGRSEETLERVEAYLKATKMFRDYSDPSNDPVFSEVSLKLAVVQLLASLPIHALTWKKENEKLT